VTGLTYDEIGRTYSVTRHPDPRIAAAIWQALDDPETVLNVGAGTGSYEPTDCELVAVEPSPVMIAQRPRDAAPVVQARAEELPFSDDSFDVAMAVLSDHHWTDRRRGFAELRRVARRRVVLFNADPGEFGLFWLNREYLPSFLEVVAERYGAPGAWEQELREAFGTVELVPVPIPHDCRDGFYGSFWRRPEAYLDPAVRAGISVFSQLSEHEIAAGVDALRRDLACGAWHERHRDLLGLDALHLGYYVVIGATGER
jgi:SAM-dependent methyltransferase